MTSLNFMSRTSFKGFFSSAGLGIAGIDSAGLIVGSEAGTTPIKAGDKRSKSGGGTKDMCLMPEGETESRPIAFRTCLCSGLNISGTMGDRYQ